VNTILQVILAVPFFILFAWVARRLLGVRRLSTLKTLLSALLGFVAAATTDDGQATAP
jgi:hypothetical protein